MTIDKIQTAGLGDNIEIGGTEAAKMPAGTTAQRANVQAGDIRFNSTLSLMEYYDGTQWKAIDSPPTISSISPSTFSASGTTITVTGSNFQTGVNVVMIASDGSQYTPDSVTRNSSSEIIFDISSSIVADEADPFDVQVTNTSGLSVTSNDVLTLAGTISLNTSAGSLGTVYDSNRAGLSYDLGVSISPSESDVSFTYSVSSGSLPTGLSLNTSTGAVTGTASAVGADTTSNFTITYLGADASDSSYAPTAGTAYSLTIAAPVVTSYTSTGSGTFTVPSGITAVDVLVVGGGGSGGGAGSDDTGGGGGGAGGLIYRPAFPVTPGGSISYTIGGGGATPGASLSGGGNNGQNSVFGTLTAQGGGGGSSYSGGVAQSGGSGGGGSTGPNTAGAQGTQPQQPGDSGTYGFGNSGGNAESYSPPAQGANSPNAGGGGGAGAGGYDGPQSPSGGGGAGRQYDISGSQLYYAGGGAGGGGQGQGGSGGGGAGRTSGNSGSGSAGTANRGGGGGGANSHGSGGGHAGGAGGTGIVIVKY
jgi:hypothetical protein